MTLVYLYAVAPAASRRWLAAEPLRGIGDLPVRAVSEGDVAGIVSDVPASEFDQEPLDRNVADASWLGPRAAAHQDVNARILAGLGSVLPLAFGTLFRGDDGVREALRSRAAELFEALERLGGRAEWVITVDRDRDAALAALDDEPRLASLVRDVSAAAPGRAYLLRRSLEDARTALLRERDAEARAALRDALAPVATDLTDEPLIEGGPIARVTALASRDQTAVGGALDRFGAEWGPRGYTPRLSGPWPPYRYAAKLGSLR
ncbi:MAG TPA: GvpL/GvpF family gas vesicle protein [Candidatus Limnocylindria bacterium]|nr:GvpL/GvpF family gas vesicle protein [Candidatus Limnocylindria bacterium]